MSGALRIAVASGKGGTGKTTIATNLAVVLAETGTRTAYVDCDVEEPNGHLFLRPTIHVTREVSIPVPEVDEARCTLCGACGKACRYSAILALPKKVLTFAKLCHGCGGCTLACPEGAIREVPRLTGLVEEGAAGQVSFLQGKLNVGEAMAPPVIRAVLAAVPTEGTTIIDAPPGTSCPVIASVKTADVVLLVTEPTPFGLNDLKLAVEMVRELGVPFGVAVNRAGMGDRAVFEYCASEDIPVLLELPNDRRIAHAYSRGELCVAALPELKPLFLELYEKLRGLARTDRPRGPAKTTVPLAEVPGPDRLPSELVRLGSKPNVDELVVISGKGGTGKTSIVASFIALAERTAMADCDVDAADLHLVLGPTVRERRPFSGGRMAVIDPALCTACGECRCRFDAIRALSDGTSASYEIDAISCEGCGVCVDVCPAHAATLVHTTNGEWFVSDTRHGPMVHARLGIAQENSGKLVSLVRREALLPVNVSCGDGTLSVMSIGFLLRDRDDAVIWRGPRKFGVIKQFLKDVEWGELDYLVVDSPPGTGDEPLAVAELIEKADGAVVVTTPQEVAVQDVRRCIVFCRQLDLPVLGVVENMSGFTCPKCGELVRIFGADGGRAMAEEMGVPYLGSIPIEPEIVVSGDSGTPMVQAKPHSETAKAVGRIVRTLLEPELRAASATAAMPAPDGKPLKIAVPVTSGVLSSHFGHCEQFVLFDVETDGKTIHNRQVLTPPPHEPGTFPRWLHEQGATIIIAGGMGSRAQSLFDQNGIRVVVGASSGEPDVLVRDFLAGRLTTGANVCDH